MRTTLATVAILLGGCSAISSSGLSNGGAPKKHDAGGTTTGGGGAAPGTPCASDDVCNSGVCGLAGSGNCCAAACSTSDPICAATGCDDGGGCDYAAVGTNCGATSCAGHVQSQPQCDGYGQCGAQALIYCPYNLDCDDAGAACITRCSSSADCLKDFKCNAGVCDAPEPVGACTEDDDCTSGHCGVGGTGHCCSGPCSTVAPCGATDCDPTSGACVYAGPGIACRPPSCDAGILEPAGACDGLGACPLSQTVNCAPNTCNGDTAACSTSCTGNADCLGGYCDTVNSKCCAVPSGGSLNVDSQFGSDLAACCGSPGSSGCQTLTHAMHVIDEARARDVTLVVSIPSDGVWAAPGEVYPVVLGWGVELQANGITFDDGDGGNRALFEIGPVSSSDDVGYASIVGGTIGGTQPPDPSTILVDPGSKLCLASALVRSSLANQTTAIEVSAGGQLLLASDCSFRNLGTVTVGTAAADMGKPALDGYNGIVCDSANGLGCVVSDHGTSSLVMFMQANHDIDAEDFAAITLSSDPTIGLSHPLGLGTCTTAEDGRISGEAILLHGKASMTIHGGSVQCVGGNGFELEASSSGTPSLTMDHGTIQNTVIGVHVPAGAAAISTSTILYNSTGVEQDSDGTNVGSIDLSGGDAGGTNLVACNAAPDGGIGVSVLNKTSQALNASNVEWDTAGPDFFKCDSTLSNCTCQGTCTLGPGANGMDAVSEAAGTIVTTGNSPATFGCIH